MDNAKNFNDSSVSPAKKKENAGHPLTRLIDYSISQQETNQTP